jgi:hypothetical protein
VREGDLVLTLGAGDITMVGEETMLRLQESLPGREESLPAGRAVGTGPVNEP